MDQAKLEVVRKLLAKAGASGTTEAESEIYTAKATQLMLKYGIEEAMIANADRAKTEPIVDKFVTVKGTFAPELMRLCTLTISALGLQPYYVKYKQSLIRVHVVGFESDVQRCELLLTSLLMQASTAMTTWWKEEKLRKREPHFFPYTASESYQLRRSFIIGFGQSVATRLDALRVNVTKEAVSSEPGTALVLISRAKQVDAWVEDNLNINTKPCGRGRSYDYSGAVGGRAAGATANLGGTGVGSEPSGKAVTS